jgi:hypothetical protein
VIADEFFGDAEMFEQFSGVSGVFASDNVNGSKSLQGTLGNVGEISDWRGDKVKCSGHKFRFEPR